ncbi:histidine kinase [Sphingobacterium sp. KU25419]|nr:histidine kinase [Sphingobacterium sp. KU25419]
MNYLSPDERLKDYLTFIIDKGILGAFRITSISDYLLDFLFLVVFPLTLKIVQSFMAIRNAKVKLELANSELELNNVQLELAFLKHQINPHFLLNTLYSIYVLVSDNDERGGASMMRLSSIMVYLLHESNQPKIELVREFQLLNDYIELERLRINDSVKIIINMTTDDDSCLIVPLLFFPFVENAFKHGPRVSSTNAWLSVNISVKKEQMHLNVSNAFRELPKSDKYIGGIGIENVRKRLELHYMNKYSLDVSSKEDVFDVNLKLDLSSIE